MRQVRLAMWARADRQARLLVEARRQEEVAQFRRDRVSWEQRLAGIAAERDRELAAFAASYRDRQPHQFPVVVVAVVFVVPKREATR